MPIGFKCVKVSPIDYIVNALVLKRFICLTTVATLAQL